MTKEIRLLHDTIWVYSKLRYNTSVSGGEKVQMLVCRAHAAQLSTVLYKPPQASNPLLRLLCEELQGLMQDLFCSYTLQPTC